VHFGISTHLYYNQPLGPAHLAELAEFGFHDIELFAARGHFDYSEPSAVGALAGWLSDTGSRLHSVHAPIVERIERGAWGRMLSTAAGSEAARQQAVAECLAALDIARTVPFTFLVLHLGVPDALASKPDDNTLAAARRSLEEIAAAAAPLGVRVAVEVIPNALSTPGRLMQLIEDDVTLPAGGAGICLDTGHAALMGDVADAIDVVSGELVTTHVHDNRGRRDDHLVPFEGTIDWATAVMSLQKVGYDGALMFELAGTDTPRDSLEKTRAVRERFASILTLDFVPEP
jgi:sugar phosphate isomerase/epimerase